MADDSDLERTEPASPRRIEQAREKGQVPRSRELATFAVLLAAGGGLTLMGSGLMHSMSDLMRLGLQLDRSAAFDASLMMSRLQQGSQDMLVAFIPFMIVMLVAALVAPMLLSGWLFSAEALQPDFSRLNPLKGIARMLSWHSVAELVKAIAKTLLIGGVAGWVIWHQKEALLALATQPLDVGVASVGSMAASTFLAIVGSMILLVVIDVPFQLWEHSSKMKMSREELRQEAKEMEGDPQIKARIRALQREAARRRMMAEVPKADVIVTNPTHYAVALRYQDKKMRAPQVVAKGSQLVAARIRELGLEHNIPIVQTPPLARALYRHAELGEEIPAALYTAVAEVLAYVYQLRRYRSEGGNAPQAPQNLPVPPSLDPEAEAA
jgi:flagellar biosynthetic protein FlhB